GTCSASLCFQPVEIGLGLDDRGVERVGDAGAAGVDEDEAAARSGDGVGADGAGPADGESAHGGSVRGDVLKILTVETTAAQRQIARRVAVFGLFALATPDLVDQHSGKPLR